MALYRIVYLLVADLLAPTGLDAGASEIFLVFSGVFALRRLENCVIVNTADMKRAFDHPRWARLFPYRGDGGH